MAATNVPQLDFGAAFVNRDGTLTNYGFAVLHGMLERTGGATDKVDQAFVTANAAVPRGTEVVAAGGLQVGGKLGGNVGLTLYRTVSAVASLAATALEGDWAYALDGCKSGESTGSGTGVPVWWSNGGWRAVDSGTVVTA